MAQLAGRLWRRAWLLGLLVPACVGGCRSVEVPDGGPVPVVAPTAPGEESSDADGEPECVVIVTAAPEFGGPPLTVKFATEVDCTAVPVTYAWDFGDGGPSNGAAQPSHTYEKAGEYVATVRVTAPDGASSDDRIAITVDAALDE